MTDNINVQIIEPPLNNLIIETQIGSEPINVSVVSYSGSNISITHDLPVLPGDINDNVASLLVPGSGINIVYNNNIPSITISASGLSSEQVQDIVGNLISGSGYVNINYDDSLNNLIIGVTGLQPSGNYANSAHNHSASDITDFNSSVSGLLPVKNISSGSGISITNNSGDFLVSVTGQFGLTSEQVDDRVNSLLVAGSYISLNYNDNLDILTINTTGLQPSGNYSTVGHSHVIGDVSGLQVALDNKQPSGTYASGVHTHTTSDITNFSSSVSGLLPVIVNSGDNRILTSTGSSVGINAESNLTFDGSLLSINGSGNFVSGLFINSIPVIVGSGLGNRAAVWKPGSSSELIDSPITIDPLVGFKYETEWGTIVLKVGEYDDELGLFALNKIDSTDTAVATYRSFYNRYEYGGALGSATIVISSGRNVGIHNNDPEYTLDINGSGNFNHSLFVSGIPVSISGHTHFSNDITDFNSGVSGLLPVKNIIAGSGIGISSASGDFTVSVTGSFGLTSEEVDDRVSNLLVAGSYINLNYDDNLNTLTVSSTGLQPSGNYSLIGHNHTIADVSGLQIALDNKQPSGIYASGIHYHTSNDITDFNSSVSGLLPVKDIVSGSGISIGSVSGVYTITTAGVAASSASSLVTNCSNRTGSVIPKMTVVYINGGHGNLPTITPAQANNEANSSKTYGITQTQINDNSIGNVVVFGSLIDVDTNQFGASEGSTLYLSPTVAGGITATKPSAPNHMVSVGKIVRNHNNQGIIEVVIQNGFELEELHNVAISGVNNGEFLQYNSSSELWVPSNSGNFSVLSVNGTGVSINGHSHTSSNITDFNSSVSGLLPVTNIAGGTNINVSSSGSVYTVSVSGSLGLTTEEVDDRVSNLLVAGSGISLNYNDNANTLTISTTKNIILSDFVGSTNYIGIAPSGTLTSSPAWRIKRTIYSSDGSISSTGTALNVSWNDRLTASYT